MKTERSSYLFEHLLTREAAYSALLEQNKRLLHRAAAEVLESRLRPGSPEDWDLLPSIALHLMAAGEYSRAHAQYCRLLLLMAQTGRYANWNESLANAEICWSRQRLDSAADPVPARSPRLLHCIAARHYAEGRFVEALPLLEEVLALAKTAGDEALIGLALTTAGAALQRLGQLPEAQQKYLEALPILEKLEDLSQQCQVHRSLGILKRDSGDRQAAEQHSRRALALAEACGDPRLQAQVRIALGNEAKMFRSFIEAREHLAHGYELSCMTGDTESQTGCLAGKAETELFLGFYAKAEAEATEALILARATGNPRSISMALNVLGGAQTYLGRFEEAEATLNESVAVSDAAAYTWGRVLTAQYIGRLARERGDLAASHSADRHCAELARSLGHAPLAAVLEARSAEWLILEGRLKEARAMIEGARPEWEQLGIAWTSLPLSISARLSVREGQLDKARAELAHFRRLATEYVFFADSFIMRDLRAIERDLARASAEAGPDG